MKISYYEGLNLAIRHAQNIAIKNDVMAEHKNLILFYLNEYKNGTTRRGPVFGRWRQYMTH